ncbi:MAG: methylenetetrahydrofolate reductase [Halioglobus sp.]|nr:methylenetetrahydrofolate reductase [Halioglobus sp.]
MKTFKNAAATRDFTISAEIFLRSDTGAAGIREQAALLKDSVDGVLLTDNQFGQLHLSTIAAASLLLANGVDPIVQLSSRNRNRIALLSELLGAGALGVSSLVLVRGDRVPEGFKPRPKAVHDLNATELIATASKLNADERMVALPEFYIGGLITPHAAKPGWLPKKLNDKVDAGARFALTHICMDMQLLRDYMKHLVAARLLRRINVFASLAIIHSEDDAKWLKKARPNVNIPDAQLKRLRQASDPEQESVRICTEQLEELREIPGISGAHLLASRELATIPAAVEAAGLRLATG